MVMKAPPANPIPRMICAPGWNEAANEINADTDDISANFDILVKINGFIAVNS
jgi:hypothetical protein